MRGKRVKQIRKAHRLMTGEGISKLELKRLKREYNALRRGSQRSRPVTSGFFRARRYRIINRSKGDQKS